MSLNSESPTVSLLRRILAVAVGCSAVWSACSCCGIARAQEGPVPPHWIWHAAGRKGDSFPAETRYFRKSFAVKEASRLALEATADDEFTLYLDGAPIASGTTWTELKPFEAKLTPGRHVLAAEARNASPGAAGFLLRGSVLPLGQGVPIHTNAGWKAAAAVPDGKGWTQLDFDDSNWTGLVDLGVLGTGPWGDLAAVKDASERFQVPQGLKVETVGTAAVTGSVVAFTFDPDGRPCVSIERGPIARLVDDDGDGRFDRRVVIAPQMENCQGLSFIGDALYAVGKGPKHDGLHRLTNPDENGVYRDVEMIREFKGGVGEHGPHAVMQGPDGKLYYNNGNHAHLQPPIDPQSPVNVAYEGELLPHYDDSRGHAAGIMAPGGEIYRSDDQGKTWKRIVAGFRNEYDFGFNRAGEIFSFDSDMEWDIGLPWYRPVRVNFCPIGAEFGWRNGSGKWPVYAVDSLPGIFDVGRGSPTGVSFYHANLLPPRYADAFLICDWSQGQILAVQARRRGAGYVGKASILVSGQPLNCTDVETGPDGAVYFTTGGRGTQGGFFRVAPVQAPSASGSGTPPVFPLDAIEIDSPLSSFSRKKIRAIREARAAEWGPALEEVARDRKEQYSDLQRIRALDLLMEFGPEPSDELLAYFTQDRKPAVRGRAAALLGLRTSESARRALTEMLLDADSSVVRRACEGLMQQPSATIPVARLIPLLASPDRWLRFAARVAIEHAELDPAVRKRLAALKHPRARIQGMLALVRATKIDEATQNQFLVQQTELLKTRLNSETRADLLRLIQLTYMLGPKKADAPASAALRPVLLELFKTTEDGPVNREAARLLAFLDEPAAVAAILAHQAGAADHAAQIHDSYCLRAMKQGWTPEAKQRIWAWFETASHWDGGFSFLGYLDFMIQDLLPRFDAAERTALLAQGDRSPFPTRVLVRSLDLASEPQRLAEVAALAGRLDPSTRAGAGADLRSMIVEKLSKIQTPEARAAFQELERAKSAATAAAAPKVIAEYKLEQLVKQVAKSAELRKAASAQRGALVIEKVRCLDCHKFGPKGQGVGPDLTTLNSRFGPAEILESIVEPSKVISDQYKSYTVATSDGKIYNGMPVVNDADNLVLLLSDGSKATIPKKEVEGHKESKTSVMPEGLLNTLTLQEIADLVALFESAPKTAAPAVGAAK